MITSEAEAKERYKQIDREADDWNRIIGVRRLRPSEVSKLIGMTPELGGHDVSNVTSDETGETREVQVPHRAALFIAGAVCEIQRLDQPVGKLTFPRNRAELDSVYDTLDTVGIAAAVKALTRLSESDKAADVQGVIDSAKNF
jgi:hypothetical protein